MSVIFENNTNVVLNVEFAALMEKLVGLTCDHRGCPFETEVSITIVDNDEIRELNKVHRGIDSETDVLSFPFIDFAEPAVFPEDLEEHAEDFFNFDSGELMLGDIVLSMEKANSQAEEYGHSREREVGFLIVHSMLHLLGYDHMEQAEEETMNQLQEEILNEAGLKR